MLQSSCCVTYDSRLRLREFMPSAFSIMMRALCFMINAACVKIHGASQSAEVMLPDFEA